MAYDFARELDLLDTLAAVDVFLPVAGDSMGSVDRARDVIWALYLGQLLTLHQESGGLLEPKVAKQALWNDQNWGPLSTAVQLRGTPELEKMMNSADRQRQLARILNLGS